MANSGSCVPLERETFDSKAVERFWGKVVVSGDDECWEWIAGKSRAGYGRIKIKPSNGAAKFTCYAHRMSYVIASGEGIPTDMFVCHTCDNPACVNPRHLFLGTIADNNWDASRKGRKAIGPKLPQAKLSMEKANEIREMLKSGRSCKLIARDYGVSVDSIRRIINGRCWRPIAKPTE